MAVDNIFSPSFGNRPSQLVGREMLLKQLIDGLNAPIGARERVTVLLGQRGFGKTVLLWELAERAASEGYIVASPTIASEGMLERIIEKIQEAGDKQISEKKMRLSGATAGALGFSVGLQFTPEIHQTKTAQYRLSQLAKAVTSQGKGLLILVDELQANSTDIRNLVITYQELIGEKQNVSLVMAGLPGAVSATLNDKVLTFLNRANKVALDPLPDTDIDAFLKKSFESLQLVLPEEFRKNAVEQIHGSPYMLQLLGHALVLYSDGKSEISRSDFDAAVASAKNDFVNDICETSLAALSEKDKEFLIAMAAFPESAQTRELAEKMGVTSDYAQKYRRRLLDAGIIKEAGFGRVDFAVPYLREWLVRTS